jgi:hypothetical protein
MILIGGSHGLTGSIPSEIGNLSRLTVLILRWCNFSGTIPSEIGLLTNMETIQWEGNNFDGTLPEELNNLTELSKLARRVVYCLGGLLL